MEWQTIKAAARGLMAAQMLSGGVLLSVVGKNMIQKPEMLTGCMCRRSTKHAGGILLIGGLTGVPLSIWFSGKNFGK